MGGLPQLHFLKEVAVCLSGVMFPASLRLWLDLPRFGGHPIVRGAEPQKGVHSEQDTPTISTTVPRGSGAFGSRVG